MSKWIGTLVGSVLVAGVACGSALAAGNPVGFYVGAGVGVGNPSEDYWQPNKFVWNALVGIQPIPFLGAELQYMDFGNPEPAFHSDDHTHALGAFGVVYLPLPGMLAPVDLFGKLGAARLWQPSGGFFAAPLGPFHAQFADSETDLAYGGGAQMSFGAIAVRLEYEAVDASFGNPWLSNVEVTWTP